MTRMRKAGEKTDKYRRQEDVRRIPRMLLAGTYGLHNEPRTYKYILPEHIDEVRDGDTSEYRARVERADIDPYYERAVNRAVASLFNKPIQLEEDVPEGIRGAKEDDSDALWFNIDGRGNNGDEFFRRVALDSIGDGGMSGVLVEFPKTPEGATRADLAGRDPYLVHYKAGDILGAERDYVNGKERLRRLWLQETARKVENGELKREREIIAPDVDEDGNTEGVVSFRVWEQKEPESDEYVILEDESGVMSPHKEIPFAVYYTGWRGFFDAMPPLLQLGYMNINHTRNRSAVTEDLIISSGAQMFRVVADEAEKDQRVLSARALLWSMPGDSGISPSAQWLERSAAASGNFQEFIRNNESRMTQLGNEVHMRRLTGNETATGKAIDTAEAKTETEAWSMALKDFIESVLGFMAVYLGADTGGSVVVSPPPRFSERDMDTIEGLFKARREGVIHPESEEDMTMILSAMKEVYNLPEDWRPEDAAQRAIARGALVPGGLERVTDALARDMLSVNEEPDEEPVMPPDMMQDEEVA